MPIFTLAMKDLRLLLRDSRSAIILMGMPVILIMVLGLSLDEAFWQKPDDKIRISVVVRDKGLPPKPGRIFPTKPWSEMVIEDMAGSPSTGLEGTGIRVEIIDSLDVARDLVARGKRASVLVFESDFSDRMDRCSFLAQPGFDPVNPLGRDGVRLDRVGLTVLTDPTQQTAAAIIEQAAQVTLFRVVIPYMIGQAFARVGDEAFMRDLSTEMMKKKPISPEVLMELDPVVQKLLGALITDPKFAAMMLAEVGFQDSATIARRAPEFRKVVHKAFEDKALMTRVGKEIAFGEVLTPAVRREVGPGVKAGVKDLFPNYNFNALTWPDLVNSTSRAVGDQNLVTYEDQSGSGVLRRGAKRYQILVPSYTVLFAFFLVLTVGWQFVAERKFGTLVRLRAAPLTRGQILLGKLLPCLVISLLQGAFLMLAGKVVFNMSWGTEPWLLIPVVVCTSMAAVGLATLVASVARNETQVAVYGTLLVLVLGGISGSLMPRDLMPEQMRQLSYVTPHAWALDAYAQVLTNPNPQLAIIGQGCAVLLGFGVVFLGLAWWRLDLD